MDKFTPEYIQNVQQIIKNDEKDKARELLKDLHPADICLLYTSTGLQHTTAGTRQQGFRTRNKNLRYIIGIIVRKVYFHHVAS